ncbi:phosphoribosylaminoimidazolesuccinocarboxamide synthase [Candidatus Pacearchaeota archaeon]|nr:phosphoribosylaminoimidazolesuccinocarboxamide synthase [Candidatus Pacearchaeota archaeon]
MGLENQALVKTDDLPIRHEGDVHSGKVRSVYWLTKEDSGRLAEENNYPVFPGSGLGVMVISDRISAFECNWKSRNGLNGVPGKGAFLNAISKHWFNRFDEEGLAKNHIVDTPHPLVWIVQKAEPVMVEGICRQYITGSMWRGYEKGDREICGIKLPKDLQEDQRLNELLITPSTKGIMRGIPGILEEEDENITRQQIVDNYEKFGFKDVLDVSIYESLLRRGFLLTEKDLKVNGKILADFKLELGYVRNVDGESEMIYIDEPVTPDSARIWDMQAYNEEGRVVEESKEGFRQFLLKMSGIDPDILLNKHRMAERVEAAREYVVPTDEFMKVADTYRGIAETITGKKVPQIENPRGEIIDSLSGYGLVV